MASPESLATRWATPPAELLAAAWLAGYSSPKTRRTYRTMLGSWFAWCATCNLDPLTARRVHVELWQPSLEQASYAERTIVLKLTAVASFYRYCEQEEVLERSPMLCVRRPRVERTSPRGALTRSQVHDLLAAADTLGAHHYGLCCVLAFNGLRISEASGLDVTDLDYDRHFFPLLRLTRKGGRPGKAILARPTEAAVLACIDGRSDGPLFLNRAGRRIDQRAAQRILDRATRDLRGRQPPVTPHLLRHT